MSVLIFPPKRSIGGPTAHDPVEPAAPVDATEQTSSSKMSTQQAATPDAIACWWICLHQGWKYRSQVPTDAQLARWLAKYTFLTGRKQVMARYDGATAADAVPVSKENGEPAYRLYREFEGPHFHKTVRHSGEQHQTSHNRNLNGDGRLKEGDDGGGNQASASRRSMHAKREAVERRMIDRLSGETEPVDFTPIRPGVVDQLWGERRVAPESSWPNLECFSNPWPITGRKKEGGYGGGSAKPANKHVGLKEIKDFKPAERPSDSELQFWEDRLNAVGKREQEEAKAKIEGNPGSSYAEHWEARSIWPQDRDGKMAGMKPFEEPRTTQLPKQEDLDAKMLRIREFNESETYKRLAELKEKGASDYQLRLVLASSGDDLLAKVLMDLGMTSAGAGKRVGIKGNSMVQRKRRDGLNRRQPVISEAIKNSAPQEEGWFQVVRLKGRKAYLVKLDMPTEPTDEQYDFAIWSARNEEPTRMFLNKLKEVGRGKLMTPDGNLTEEGRELLNDLRIKVREAFDKGMVLRLDKDRVHAKAA